jgi:hypothetical protein
MFKVTTDEGNTPKRPTAVAVQQLAGNTFEFAFLPAEATPGGRCPKLPAAASCFKSSNPFG